MGLYRRNCEQIFTGSLALTALKAGGVWDATAAENFKSSGERGLNNYQLYSQSSLVTLESSIITPTSTMSPISNISSSPPIASATHAGAIAGGVVGGFVCLASILLVCLVVYRVRNRSKVADTSPKPPGEKADTGDLNTPPSAPAHNSMVDIQTQNERFYVSRRILLLLISFNG